MVLKTIFVTLYVSQLFFSWEHEYLWKVCNLIIGILTEYLFSRDTWFDKSKIICNWKRVGYSNEDLNGKEVKEQCRQCTIHDDREVAFVQPLKDNVYEKKHCHRRKNDWLFIWCHSYREADRDLMTTVEMH